MLCYTITQIRSILILILMLHNNINSKKRMNTTNQKQICLSVSPAGIMQPNLISDACFLLTLFLPSLDESCFNFLELAEHLPVGTYESSLLVFSKANMSTESVPNFCFLSTAAKGNVPNALVDLLCIPPPCLSMPRATSRLPCA